MCYQVYISTTSKTNLAAVELPGLTFEPVAGNQLDSDPVKSLTHPQKWFLSRYGGCSCHFRHFAPYSGDLEFLEPQDSFPEKDDEVQSTAAVYDVLAQIVADGHQLEAIDSWNDEFVGEARMLVSLTKVSRGAFRFFENVAFRIVP